MRGLMGNWAKLKFGDKISAILERGAEEQARVKICSKWDVEHWRGDQMLSKTLDRNIVTNEGLNALLDIMFHASTQITTWYVGITKTAATTPAATMSYATPVFTESSDYSESTRAEYVEAAAASKSITNTANKATFTANTTVDIYGGFLCGGGTSASSKGDTAGGGKLFCFANFSSVKSMTSGDVLKVVVTIDVADA